MAKTKNVGAAYPSISGQEDWRAKDDLSTLKRASEVFIDRARMRGVMAQIKVEKKQDVCLASMLSEFRKHKQEHLNGTADKSYA